MRRYGKCIFAALALVLVLGLSACQLKTVEPFSLGMTPGNSGGRMLRGSGTVAERRVSLDSEIESFRLSISGISLQWNQTQNQHKAEDLVIDESYAREIKLSTDDNLHEWIQISCDTTGLIRITVEDNRVLSPTQLRIEVGAPVEELVLDGAWNTYYNCPGVQVCSIRFSGAAKGDFTFGDLERLNCILNGACDLTLRGLAQRANFTINGASQIAAFDLSAETADVTINGAGKCEITAAQSLAAEVNGVGSIIYDGGPTVRRAVHGLGEIRAR